jgi:hypothetical protein
MKGKIGNDDGKVEREDRERTIGRKIGKEMGWKAGWKEDRKEYMNEERTIER